MGCSCSSQVVAKAFPMGSILYSPSPLPSEPVPFWQRVRQLCQQAFDVCTHQLIGLGSSPHLLFTRSKETHVEATLSVDTREGKWWGPWGNVGKVDQAADPSNPITEIWVCCSLPSLLTQKLSSEPDCSVLERGQLVLVGFSWVTVYWEYWWLCKVQKELLNWHTMNQLCTREIYACCFLSCILYLWTLCMSVCVYSLSWVLPGSLQVIYTIIPIFLFNSSILVNIWSLFYRGNDGSGRS